PIDMYIVPASGLADYINDSAPRFFPYQWNENRTTIVGTFGGTPQNAGIDAVIVDNVDFTGAMPSGDVTVTVELTRTLRSGPSAAVLGGILIAVVIIIALLLVVALRARKKRAMAPPPMGPPA